MDRAVLLDVGGTLWPERLTAHVGEDRSLEQLASLLPGMDPARVLAALRAELRQDDSLAQNTHVVLAHGLQALGVNTAEVDVVAVRRALCAPAVPGLRLFPEAADLLVGLARLSLRRVVISNVQVRGATEYWRDLSDLGIAHLVDAVVTSLDVGFRKPHPAFFEAALRAAGCQTTGSVMIGNSEANDIEPAVLMGMHAIRVAIEEPPPMKTVAHTVVTNLEAALETVRRWAIET
jgi:FMN phosphatase YigB (HAD superfamily)